MRREHERYDGKKDGRKNEQSLPVNVSKECEKRRTEGRKEGQKKETAVTPTKLDLVNELEHE